MICRGTSPHKSLHFLFGGKNMDYEKMVVKILDDVERILREEALFSQGANIRIEIGRDRVSTISYEIKDKAVVI